MASPSMTLKLLVDKKAQKVLFAEATMQRICGFPFPHNIFSLPLGTLVQFLGSKEMLGCLGDLKESLENFNETYLQTGIDKDVIFDHPKMTFNGNMFLLLNDAFEDDKPAAPKTVYKCGYKIGRGYDGYSGCPLNNVSEHPDVLCPSCGHLMNIPLKIVSPPNKEQVVVKEAVGHMRKLRGGYVKDVVTYMVLDNLVVKLN